MPITWGDPTKRFYHHGLDRGVIYIPGQAPVAWNGLISVDEDKEAPAPKLTYRDGQLIMAEVDASDFSATLTCMHYPAEFGVCVGMPQIKPGLYLGNQKPKRFNLSYRTLVGSGAAGDYFGYELHFIYNAVPSISSRARRTMSDEAQPIEFTFDLVCTPLLDGKVPFYRPTAHVVVDTRTLAPGKIAAIENLLYGVGPVPGRLPTPFEINGNLV